jgi:hypothetical protein
VRTFTEKAFSAIAVETEQFKVIFGKAIRLEPSIEARPRKAVSPMLAAVVVDVVNAEKFRRCLAATRAPPAVCL